MQFKLNYHITERCNFQCKFCFARYEKQMLDFDSQKKAIERIAESGFFSEINFAGGEPFLYKNTVALIKFAYFKGLKVSVITNGFLLSAALLEEILPYISMLGISYHSFDERTQKAIGFCTREKKTISNQRLLQICDYIERYNRQNQSNCTVKINTVVCKENKDENLVLNMEKLPGIQRWKILNCQPFQNNQDMVISNTDFDLFCKNNNSSQIKQVFEEDMSHSYIMMNPAGEFIKKDEEKSNYESVGSVLTDSISTLLERINLDKIEYDLRYAS